MLYQLGKLTIRFRWPIILFWALLFLASLFFAPRVASQLKGGFGAADTESRRALELLQEKFNLSESVITLVFSSDTLTAQDARYREEMEKVFTPLRQRPSVTGITTFYEGGSARMVSKDGHTTYALVSLNLPIDQAVDAFPDINRSLGSSALKVQGTGGIAIFADLNEASERDLRRGETIALPLVLVALILVFGGLVAAGLPVAMGLVSVSLALAVTYGLAQVTDVSIFALNIVSFLGLGIAVDYSLLVVSRFREELAVHPKDEALARTMAYSGRTLLFSGATSMLGLSGLLLFQFMMLRSLGLGGILVVLISLLVALTLVPAVLGVLGPRVNSLTVLRLRGARGGYWHRLATGVMRHPVLVAVPLLAVLLFLGAPFLGVKLGAPWASILPLDAPSRQGWQLVEDKMGAGELAPVVVVLRFDGPVLTADNLIALRTYTERWRQDPRVERVESLVSQAPNLTRAELEALLANVPREDPRVGQALKDFVRDDTTVVRVFSRFSPVAEESRELVRELRAAPVGEPATVLVTGATADLMDSIDAMYSDFPKAVLFIMGSIFVALLLLFRSLLLPLKAVLMNLMSIFASYGALVFIFQQGHFQRLLGFQANGFTEASIPILLFCILFGLSMDYEIFLLSRVKEAYDETGNNTLSVAQGLERTGPVITSAALILVLVAAGFATGDIMLVKALGIGTAIAIFLDATVVRALLAPALMRILGDWNWWAPRFMKGRIPSGDLTASKLE